MVSLIKPEYIKPIDNINPTLFSNKVVLDDSLFTTDIKEYDDVWKPIEKQVIKEYTDEWKSIERWIGNEIVDTRFTPTINRIGSLNSKLKLMFKQKVDGGDGFGVIISILTLAYINHLNKK